MSAATGAAGRTRRAPVRGHRGRVALVVLGGGAASLLILLPLGAVFYFAFRDGWAVYARHLADPSTRHAVWLTLLAAAVAVPVNTAFGVTAAWAAARFRFPGRRLLISLIELPLSIPPLVMGVACLFIFGMQGFLGPWLLAHGLRLVFSVPGILIVTTMVTTPFVFREVLPLMLSQGAEEELAALTLGAGGWKTFLHVTLPNIRWALFYGVSLCFARCLGEFGSVAVVSGSIRDETNTMTLQIELLSNDLTDTGAFALASVLSSIAVLTLVVKIAVERRVARDAGAGSGSEGT